MENLNYNLVLACIIIAIYLPIAVGSMISFAKNNVQHLGRVEFAGAIAYAEDSTFVKCSILCALNSHCLTLFYNAETKQCVLHSKSFHFETPSAVEAGWKHYILREVGPRCPYPYLYYRALDFCYLIDEIDNIDYQKIKDKCAAHGGKLAAIENQEKYDYFRHILAGRPHKRVSIMGTRINANEWRLDDNSVLTFFNWHPTEPHNQNCLELYTDDQHYDCRCVFNTQTPTPSVFLCEI